VRKKEAEKLGFRALSPLVDTHVRKKEAEKLGFGALSPHVDIHARKRRLCGFGVWGGLVFRLITFGHLHRK
jgi:hypothetical protein